MMTLLRIFSFRFEVIILSVLFFPPFCELSPFTKNYDIWDDEPKENGVNKIFYDRPYNKQPVKYGDNVESRRKGKILGFFTFTNEDECKAEDGRRSGICLNAYKCRRTGGTSSGYCAHGFGVCCVSTVTCGKEMKNNITYFISPEFPSLSRNLGSCILYVKKMEGASQLRLDFIHFNLGQPNRLTGECDSDVFIMAGGNSKDFKLCGQNSGQHVYYDIDKNVDMVLLSMHLSRPTLQRLWEIKVTQVPFAQRAPAGCMQYHTTDTGIIQTLNFAENGRHLADQDYRACVRRSRGKCSIAYEPCDRNSFRIGPNAALASQTGMAFGGGPGSFGGAGSEIMSTIQDFGGYNDQFMATPIQGDPVADATDDQLETVGSGDDAIPAMATNQVSRQFTRWSPYAQHLGGNRHGNNSYELWRYWGYGNYGQGVSSFGRQRCQDRIITPCESDEFLGASPYSPGVCDPYHCGSTLCPDITGKETCRLETSVKPFAVGVRFGPPSPKPSPEDNIGVCLKFEQLPCSG